MAVAALPRCPPHLSDTARREWRRLAAPLHEIGVLTLADRAVLAAYCQAYSRWVEAEQNLSKTPMLLKTPSGYAQQSPWLSIANKQLELMARFMGELGLTPVARRRVEIETATGPEPITKIEFVTVYTDENGKRVERSAGTWDPDANNNASNSKRIGVKWQD
ncbi:phage terminase small subunit P27 family [Oceanicola sp. D3]|uniref:phage terminase small subunit P27 family n=1 Tax=Oceanicola sp. D3 TaxID=2587163 RepID=UPI0020C7A747|nr:phage terminase small subunit P27 family [Oceanicola sp. D3]